MVLILKLAIFIFCIRHVMTKGRPGVTAIIYAGAHLALGLLLMVVQPFSWLYVAALGITLLYNLATGFLFFWLIDRYQDSYFALFAIIILGIAASIAIRFILSAAMGI